MANEMLRKFAGIIELLAYLLVIISVFLPYVSVDLGNNRYFGSLSESANYINTYATSGVCVLIFCIISTIFVAVNTFTRNVIENLKNDNKNSAKTIDVMAELIPFIFTFISFILIIVNANEASTDVEKANLFLNIVNLGIGFYLLLIGIIVALAVRILYIIFGKGYIKFSNEPKVEEVEQTADVNVQIVKY